MTGRRGLAPSIAAAVLRSLASFLFWVVVAIVLFAALAGDPMADARPRTALDRYAEPVAIVAVAVLVHAALMLASERGWLRPGGRNASGR